MSAGVFGNVLLPAIQHAPARDLVEESGSVNACRLTKRAPDKWESARFQALCVA
jgi:hypothetical protein